MGIIIIEMMTRFPCFSIRQAFRLAFVSLKEHMYAMDSALPLRWHGPKQNSVLNLIFFQSQRKTLLLRFARRSVHLPLYHRLGHDGDGDMIIRIIAEKFGLAEKISQ